VGKKQNKAWLVYAYHRESGAIVAYVWGNRDIKTAQKLRKRIQPLGISYGWVGQLSGNVWGRPAYSREKAHGRDSGE
jgi:IS1 family transposase